jgi:phosphatidyl-myo-inositol alpha-mannosyltransferase
MAVDDPRPVQARAPPSSEEEVGMKIGIVSPYAYPRPGGANDNIRETYENLRERGHEVRIITAPWGDDPPAQDVIQIGQAIAIPYNGSVGRITLSARLEYLVTKILDRERFDIIHHHEPLVPLLSAQILDRKACPQVATFHAFGGFSFGYWLGRPIAQRYMDKLDGRIAVSSAARHFISRYFPGEYRIIPNGVNVDFFTNAKPFPEYRDGKTNILFVGRLEPRKGATFLVQAYAKLKARHPEIRLIVIGRGPQLGDLRELVRKEQVTDVLFAGRASDVDKARFYKTADIFCAPSTGQESFGVVLLEAMAAGTAAVASDIHGYKKVIQRNVSGLLVEPKDVDALCSALERLVEEPALRERLGAAGSVRAREFDWSHVTDQLLAFYAEVIGAYRGA